MKKFAGLNEKYSNYETAKIALLPVPYDKTSTWIKGADDGPEALLEASEALEWFDIETKTEVYRHGIATLPEVDDDSTPEKLCAAVDDAVSQILSDEKFPVRARIVVVDHLQSGRTHPLPSFSAHTPR